MNAVCDRVLCMTVEPIDAFERRFANWVRWCNQRGFHQGQCASLEGAYRSPQVWHPPEPRPESIDLPDAILVNRAYLQLALHAEAYARALKVLVFMPWLKPTRQAQILGTHYLRLDDLLMKSKQMLRNQLRMS